MKHHSIQQALKKGKGQVSLRGWVYRERGSNKLKFIVLRDSTNIIQCILKKEEFENQWREIDALQIEASIQVTGTLKKDPRAPTGYELHVKEFKIIGTSEKFPITKDQSHEFLLDMRHLSLRSRRLTSVMKIRSTVFAAIHEYFRKKEFHEFHSPILTPNACEGGSTLFKVNYYNKPIFLTQTWQLYAEAGIHLLEKIYTIAPTFRAEKSKTSRHLTEFWMAEMEEAWCDFEKLQDHGEDLIKHIVKNVLKENKQELKVLERDIKKLEPTINTKFPRITYTQALDILDKKKKLKVKWGKDLRTIEEDKLSEFYKTPLIITRYPKEVKAFYMKEDTKDSKVVLGFDMIAPEGYGEIMGASEREDKIEILIQRLKKEGENPDNYNWYLDTRRYGSVPHSGFGLGVERVIAWICGIDNIKDAIAFPRTMTRIKP
jgi:asparaginyl-tRNA synthetase